MTLYNLVLFFHILAMAGLMIAVTFQLTLLHGAASAREGKESVCVIRAAARLPLVLSLSLLVVLGTGIYMAGRINAFDRGWISATFLSILLIIAIGIVGGPTSRALQRYAREAKYEEVRRTLLNPLSIIPGRLQFALLLAITFLMVVRTNLVLSLQIVGIGIALGLLWSISTWRTGRF